MAHYRIVEPGAVAGVQPKVLLVPADSQAVHSSPKPLVSQQVSDEFVAKIGALYENPRESKSKIAIRILCESGWSGKR